MNWIEKIRPQILAAILILGVVSTYALYLGFTEIAAGAIGGLIALSMKILEPFNEVDDEDNPKNKLPIQ